MRIYAGKIDLETLLSPEIRIVSGSLDIELLCTAISVSFALRKGSVNKRCTAFDQTFDSHSVARQEDRNTVYSNWLSRASG